MSAFRPSLNRFSQIDFGDKTLRVDEEEVVLTRKNCASVGDIKQLRHKDSYVHDKNNQIQGTSLRKLSMVIFLNDNIDEVY